MAHQPSSPSKSLKFSQSSSWLKQKGAALIFMAFILGLGAATYVLKTYNADAARAKQDEKTYQALKDAKVALIAWAVNHPNTPGLMPYPDRNGDGNYDDTSDCYASNVNFAPYFTIGRLPLFKNDPNCVNAKNTVESGLAGDIRDGTGERLWYEVSQNLLHDYKNNGDPAGTSPIINPSIINTPTYKWFVVRDRSGAIISDRVAAVIIAPGAPVGDQDRSSGIAGANQYLDKVYMVDGKAYTNYTYYDSAMPTLLQEFIIGDDMRTVSKTDPTYKNQTTEPYYFNDKLVYITIDELMAALSARAAAEAKTQVLNYNAATGYYPFASALVLTEHYQRNNQFAGFLPTQQPTQTGVKSCSVTYTSANSSSSTCNSFSISNVEFTRTSGTFSSTTGSECVLINANKTCSCNITTGTSRCNGSFGRRFTCTTAGCSTSGTLPGSYKFNGAFKFLPSTTLVKVNKETGVCKGCGGNDVTCASSSAATGGFSYDVTTLPADFNAPLTNSILPAWFINNDWQNYIFYNVSSNCVIGQLCDNPDVVLGAKSAAPAMIAATGGAIISAPFATKGSAQTHAGCDVKEYLDSLENTNLDANFEANNKQRTSNYNDQTFLVSP